MSDHRFYHSATPTYVDFDLRDRAHVELAMLLKSARHGAVYNMSDKDRRHVARLFLRVFKNPRLGPRTDVSMWSRENGHAEMGSSFPPFAF